MPKSPIRLDYEAVKPRGREPLRFGVRYVLYSLGKALLILFLLWLAFIAIMGWRD